MKFKLFKGRGQQVKEQPPAEDKEVRKAAGGESRPGVILTLWRIALPAMLGASLGWLASSGLAMFLGERFPSQLSAKGAASSPKERNKSDETGYEQFLASNPFAISPMPAPVQESAQDEPSAAVAEGSLATAVLRGTLPGIGAWMEDEGKTRLVLIGDSFDVYALENVTYMEAVFAKGDDVIVREMVYGPSGGAKRQRQPQQARQQDRRNAEAPVGDIVASTPDQEGQVPSGLVQDLVQNPFDELKKVRLRPKDGEPGLQIQWIQEDSILKQLGVQKGDVIKAVNGIPFTNMADIANSINSLMNSERFDVEVNRGGQATALRYVVR